MLNFNIFNFLFISIPEEFLITLFAAALLGRKEVFKIKILMITAFVAAAVFEIERLLLYDNQMATVVTQLVSLMVVLYFCFRINYIEAIIVSLFTLITVSTILAAIVSMGTVLIKQIFSDYATSLVTKLIIIVPEMAIIGFISYLIYSKRLVRIKIRACKLKEVQENKIRFIVLLLTFTFLIAMVNYKIFLKCMNIFTSSYDKFLLFSSITIVFSFAIIILIYSMKLIKNIQDAEDYKREIMNKEFAQNIDYLHCLLENRDYQEAENLLIILKKHALEQSCRLNIKS